MLERGLGSQSIPGLKSVTPVRGNGASEAVYSYNGVSAEMDLTTLNTRDGQHRVWPGVGRKEVREGWELGTRHSIGPVVNIISSLSHI